MGEVRFKYLEELEKSEALDALNDRKSKKRESEKMSLHSGYVILSILN